MDPVSAALNAFAMFNQFLCTPAGQALATANQALMSLLLGKLGVHLAPNEPKP